MTDLLDLSGLTVEQNVENEHQYSIKAGRRWERTHCPHCGSVALRPNGLREVRIHDLPMHGKRDGIWFDRQRFKTMKSVDHSVAVGVSDGCAHVVLIALSRAWLRAMA